MSSVSPLCSPWLFLPCLPFFLLLLLDSGHQCVKAHSLVFNPPAPVCLAFGSFDELRMGLSYKPVRLIIHGLHARVT